MKCTCDSRDLFNFGCRCKKEGPLKLTCNGRVVNLDPIDIGSILPAHLLPARKGGLFILWADFEDAVARALPGAPLADISEFATSIWEKLK